MKVSILCVFFCSEHVLKVAQQVSRDDLVSVGTCFGKMTKGKQFRLHITALDYLAPYAKVSLEQLWFSGASVQ